MEALSFPAESGYTSATSLRARGWTDAGIRRFLGQPDCIEEFKVYGRGWCTRHLYLSARVREIEQSPEFAGWHAKSQRRKASARRAVHVREANMVRRMEDVEITIQGGWTEDQIRALALRTHGGNYQGNPGPFTWSARTARNCIRHNLTNYEMLWGLCNRGATGREAYEVLRRRVDALIDTTYPEFAESGWAAEPRPAPDAGK